MFLFLISKRYFSVLQTLTCLPASLTERSPAKQGQCFMFYVDDSKERTESEEEDEAVEGKCAVAH